VTLADQGKIWYKRGARAAVFAADKNNPLFFRRVLLFLEKYGIIHLDS
jgi:hypothetical protein